MRATASLLAIALTTAPVVAQASEPAAADPFKPVQPAWPSDWNDGKSQPSANKPAKPTAKPAEQPEEPKAQADDNEVFTFDGEAPSQEAGDDAEEPAAKEPEQETEEMPAAAPVEQEEVAVSAKPISDVDLKMPNTLIITGAALIGVAVIAGLATGIALDDPGLAALSFAGGGVVGLGVMTTGVVLRNDRLEAAGHAATPAVAPGLTLKLQMAR